MDGKGSSIVVFNSVQDFPFFAILSTYDCEKNEILACVERMLGRSNLLHEGRWVSLEHEQVHCEEDGGDYSPDGWPEYDKNRFGATLVRVVDTRQLPLAVGGYCSSIQVLVARFDC